MYVISLVSGEGAYVITMRGNRKYEAFRSLLRVHRVFRKITICMFALTIVDT